jgi:hypothetical protein
MARRIFQLRVTLDGTQPPVWRRLLVPGGYTLDRVHRVIQLGMGWHGSHLHSIDVDGDTFGEPDPDGELGVRDELDVRLDEVATKGTRLTYLYDFGDWWEHEVEVEDILPADPEQLYPACTAGAGACPPEDVGGTAAYAELRAALTDPDDPEHEDAREWAGPRFDPTAFDPERTSVLLRRMT